MTHTDSNISGVTITEEMIDNVRTTEETTEVIDVINPA